MVPSTGILTYFYSLAGILVFNGDDLLDDGDLVCLGKQACREDESEEECILEYNLDRGRSEGTDGRPCILQEIDRRVVIVLIVH